jgi:DnaJ-class molecular chaperone
MIQPVDYYQWLEVECKAELDTVKRVFLAQATRWHPNKSPYGRKRCERAFCELAEAFFVLSSEELRSIYDKHGAGEVKKQCKSHDLNQFTLDDALDVYNLALRGSTVCISLNDEKWHEKNEIFTGGLLSKNHERYVLSAQENNGDNVERYVKTVLVERDGRRVKKTTTTLVRPDGSREVVEEEKEEPIQNNEFND